MRETEFSIPELIVYYWQRLSLIRDPHQRANLSLKDFPEVKYCPQKWKAFDIAVELHRNSSKPIVG
ncbi:hypothetical protein NOS3756_59450 (plasmid) [Nostoc sp. NIES-3756]|uniref:hypothetical protein n=1 Tax=Nostoc sp. NIES-3756 TaxID=1751286 RepID=UPI0007210565|nr:hypothetical protein [Nostoc sp. NIES-3756]BAT56933.1 hypothetical protein NOS3756_59450 [Nostoc sp. NIES-3756]BAY41392.1 hypothetical protein NIES2111_57880 [Nostoc sp. NIES-2111]BAY41757.1 hypothetical protein NIES2111_61530 [Nostoc sp. NIES-2111]